MSSLETASVTAQNTGTSAITVRGARLVDISVYGTWVATVHLQRKRMGDSTWRDIESYAANVEKTAQMATTWDMRLFCKTGNFTSGTISMEISAGDVGA